MFNRVINQLVVFAILWIINLSCLLSACASFFGAQVAPFWENHQASWECQSQETNTSYLVNSFKLGFIFPLSCEVSIFLNSFLFLVLGSLARTILVVIMTLLLVLKENLTPLQACCLHFPKFHVMSSCC